MSPAHSSSRKTLSIIIVFFAILIGLFWTFILRSTPTTPDQTSTPTLDTPDTPTNPTPATTSSTPSDTQPPESPAGPAILKGQVVTKDGEGIPGAQVHASIRLTSDSGKPGHAAETEASAVTAADGWFELHVPSDITATSAAECRLHVAAQDYQEKDAAVALSDWLTEPPRIELRLLPATVSGRVQDAWERPVEGATVRLTTPANTAENTSASDSQPISRHSVTGMTGENGEFVITDIEPGSYEAYVEVDTGYNHIGFRLPDPSDSDSIALMYSPLGLVDLKPGEEHKDLLLTMPACRSLPRYVTTGILVTPDGTPLTGRPIDVSYVTSDNQVLVAMTGSASDDKGRFTFSADHDDIHHLVLRIKLHYSSAEMSEDYLEYTVLAGEKDVRIVIDMESISFSIRVIDTDTRMPLENAEVRIRTMSEWMAATNGVCLFKNIVVGDYAAEVRAPGYPMIRRGISVQKNMAQTIDLEVSRSAQLQVNILPAPTLPDYEWAQWALTRDLTSLFYPSIGRSDHAPSGVMSSEKNEEGTLFTIGGNVPHRLTAYFLGKTHPEYHESHRVFYIDGITVPVGETGTLTVSWGGACSLTIQNYTQAINGFELRNTSPISWVSASGSAKFHSVTLSDRFGADGDGITGTGCLPCGSYELTWSDENGQETLPVQFTHDGQEIVLDWDNQ